MELEKQWMEVRGHGIRDTMEVGVSGVRGNGNRGTTCVLRWLGIAELQTQWGGGCRVRVRGTRDTIGWVLGGEGSRT